MSSITLHIPKSITLPDNDQWQHRFEIRSESSNRLYTIAQNKKAKFWGCSCPGWITRGKCKHLVAMGIPTNRTPYEPHIIQD